MKFSANDILSQTFSSKLMGYAPEQVDEFLVSIANEWTRLVKELETVHSQNQSLVAEVKDFRRRERSLHDSLQMAKSLADDVQKKAEDEASRIIENAEFEGEQIVELAEKRLKRIHTEIEEMEEQGSRLKKELRAILSAHLDLLEHANFNDKTSFGTNEDANGDLPDQLQNDVCEDEEKGTTSMATVKRRPVGPKISRKSKVEEIDSETLL